jgi:hypothetical protein
MGVQEIPTPTEEPAMIHETVATVRNTERVVVEFSTLCDLTVQGEEPAGRVTCPVCLQRLAMLDA